MRLHNRQLKATFWNDPDILQWARDKRWFYEGLVHLADDSGCLEDSTFAFKLSLFPSPVDADITVERLAEWRDELIEARKIVRYRAENKDCLYLVNFHKHQSLKNPEKPDVPLPPWVRWVVYESNERAGKYLISDDVLTAFLRDSDVVLLIEVEEKEKRREIKEIPLPAVADKGCVSTDGAQSIPTTGNAQMRSAEKSEYTPEFEEFWAVYPRKVEKKAAYAKWRARMSGHAPPDMLIAAARGYRLYCEHQQIEERYVMHPRTFLGPGDRYEEFVGYSPPANASKRTGQASQQRDERYNAFYELFPDA